MQKILKKSLITRKYIHCKILHTIKSDVFKLPNNKNIENLFSKYELFSLDQKLFSLDLIYLKYWCCNTPCLELPYVPQNLCKTILWLTKIRLYCYPNHALCWLPNFFLIPFHQTPQLLNILNHMSSQSNLLSSYI